MTQGLVLGKFMPLHAGHISLIDFASHRCEQLIVLLCSHRNEPISGHQRAQWLKEQYKNIHNILIDHLEYNPEHLTDSSVASYENASPWAAMIKSRYPALTHIFSSEPYGDYLADILQIVHICFEQNRSTVKVSGSLIRENPLLHWNELLEITQPYFVKSVCLLGSESTGKSTLAEKLAHYYHTVFVPEAGREVLAHTNECKYEDLFTIAELHSSKILTLQRQANRLLFIDTDINITKSYSLYLFNKLLLLPEWMEDTNKFDLYFFLETDCPYVQDGTRLTKDQREELNMSHKNLLMKNNINYTVLIGDWDERFQSAVKVINRVFGL